MLEVFWAGEAATESLLLLGNTLVLEMAVFFQQFDPCAASTSRSVAATAVLALALLTQCLPAVAWADSTLPTALSRVYTRVLHQHQHPRPGCASASNGCGASADGGGLSWSEFPSLLPFLMYSVSRGCGGGGELLSIGGCVPGCLDVAHLLRVLAPPTSVGMERQRAAVDIEAAGLNWWYCNTRQARELTVDSSTGPTLTVADPMADESVPDLPPLPSLLYNSSLALQLLQQQEQR